MANRVYEGYPQVYTPELLNIFGRIGNDLTVSGMVVQGSGESYILLLPEATMVSPTYIVPKPDEWSAILAQSDNPTMFEQDDTGAMKAIVRKSQYAISGGVQQQIWFRDNYTCVYCGRGNEVQGLTLSVDHFMPVILGG